MAAARGSSTWAPPHPRATDRARTVRRAQAAQAPAAARAGRAAAWPTPAARACCRSWRFCCSSSRVRSGPGRGVLLEHLLDLDRHDAEDGARRVLHHDPGVVALDLGRAERLEPLDLRLDIVSLDVEVDPRHVVAGRLDHELHARRRLAEDDVLRELVVGLPVLAEGG